MILFLTDTSPDFGADYLYDGFARTFGIEHVVDHPAKRSLHGMLAGFDCDLNWPRCSEYDKVNYVTDALADGSVELLVVPTLRGDVVGRLHAWANNGLLAKVRDCTVCYDAEDHSQNTKQHFVDALGYEPVAYFKRELPIGATWATPLPFGYPEDRMVDPLTLGVERSGFHYNAYLWDWTRGGLREQLAEALDDLRGGNEFRGSVRAARSPKYRMTVADNHRSNQRALVAVSPAGMGSTTNRHLESVSDGCAPIIQTLTVQWPNMFHAGTEALYFSTVDECVSHVRTLLGDPAYAIGMAQAAQAKLRACHTTTVRARTVWESVHGNG